MEFYIIVKNSVIKNFTFNENEILPIQAINFNLNSNLYYSQIIFSSFKKAFSYFEENKKPEERKQDFSIVKCSMTDDELLSCLQNLILGNIFKNGKCNVIDSVYMA